MTKKTKERLDLADKLSFFHSILTGEKNSNFSRLHNMPYVFKEDLMKKTSRNDLVLRGDRFLICLH